MEIVFNKTKKILLILILTLVFISLGTTIFAAEKFHLGTTAVVMYQDRQYPLTPNKNNVKYKSSNNWFATVDDKGVITAKRIGIITITGTTPDGETATCKVRIKMKTGLIDRIRGMGLNISSATVYKNRQLVINEYLLTNQIKEWKSSDENIVKIDYKGAHVAKLTAKNPGTAEITVTNSRGKKITVDIVVKEPETQATQPQTVNVTGVTLNKTSATIEKGKTLNLTATVNPSNATNKTVTWTSSNTNIATVDSSGKVTAKAVGTATITATVGGKKVTCTITVSDPYKYSWNGNTYKIVVRKDKLDEVLSVIKEENISQYRGSVYGGKNTTDKCIRIATYHNYLLLGKISVGSANLTDALSETYYNNLNSYSKKQEEKNGSSGFYTKIKTWLDNGYPVRLKVDPSGGNLHYVTVVGYKDDASGLDDLLMIGSYSGTLINGTGSADVEKIHSDYYANIYKK